MCSCVHKIVTPNMVFVLRAKSYARPIVKPKTTTFWLLFRYFKPLLFPNSFDTFVILSSSSLCLCLFSGVSVPTMHARKFNDSLCHWCFVAAHSRQISLGCSGLFEYFARPPLGDLVMCYQCCNSISFPARAPRNFQQKSLTPKQFLGALLYPNSNLRRVF